MGTNTVVSVDRVEYEKSRLERVRKLLEEKRETISRLENVEKELEHFISLLEGVVVTQVKLHAANQENPEYFDDELKATDVASEAEKKVTRVKVNVQLAYRTLILKHYGSVDATFTESDIRNVSTVEGLTVKDGYITRQYSNYVLKNLVDSKFLERISRGLYRMVQPESVTEAADRVDDKENDENDIPILPE